jgi:hypothetical protein
MKEQINTILKAVGLKAEEIKLAEAKLKDGVTMIEATPDFEAGAAVMVKTEDEQLIPVPVSGEGEAYELEDGRAFKVAEEGVISEMVEVEEEEAEEPTEEVAEEVTEEPAEEVEASEEVRPAKSIIESIVKETKFSKESALIEALTAEITELKSQLEASTKVEEVEEEVTEEVELSEVKPIAHNPEPKAEVKLHTFGNKRKRGTTDSVMSKIAKLSK